MVISSTLYCLEFSTRITNIDRSEEYAAQEFSTNKSKDMATKLRVLADSLDPPERKDRDVEKEILDGYSGTGC